MPTYVQEAVRPASHKLPLLQQQPEATMLLPFPGAAVGSGTVGVAAVALLRVILSNILHSKMHASTASLGSAASFDLRQVVVPTQHDSAAGSSSLSAVTPVARKCGCGAVGSNCVRARHCLKCNAANLKGGYAV